MLRAGVRTIRPSDTVLGAAGHGSGVHRVYTVLDPTGDYTPEQLAEAEALIDRDKGRLDWLIDAGHSLTLNTPDTAANIPRWAASWTTPARSRSQGRRSPTWRPTAGRSGANGETPRPGAAVGRREGAVCCDQRLPSGPHHRALRKPRRRRSGVGTHALRALWARMLAGPQARGGRRPASGGGRLERHLVGGNRDGEIVDEPVGEMRLVELPIRRLSN